MSQLINELKGDHVTLLQTIKEIKALRIGSDEANQKLMAVKSGLLNHLKKEDELLYPKLNKIAESDEIVKKRLEAFAADMDQISAKALAFFEKYETAGTGIDFFKDVGQLFAILAERIRKEEAIIYPLYTE